MIELKKETYNFIYLISKNLLIVYLVLFFLNLLSIIRFENSLFLNLLGITGILLLIISIPSKFLYIITNKSYIISAVLKIFFIFFISLIITSQYNPLFQYLHGIKLITIPEQLKIPLELVLILAISISFYIPVVKDNNSIRINKLKTAINRFFHFFETKVGMCVLIIIILASFIRLFYLNYIDGLDNFTSLAVKNMCTNSISYYKNAVFSDFIWSKLCNLFGFGYYILRLPAIIYSIITELFLYLTLRKFSKKMALITLFIIAVSPWAIIMSRLIREYAFDAMIAAVCFFVSNNIRTSTVKLQSKIIRLILLIAFVISLSIINNRVQTFIVSIIPLITIPFVIYYERAIEIKKIVYKISLKFKFLLTILGVILIYFFNYSDFPKGISFNIAYLKVFFDPLVVAPWQWFHSSIITYVLIVYIFFLPLYLIIFRFKQNRDLMYYIYFIFGLSLALFVFKFQPHSNDYPTRYIYFLFIIYSSIFGFTFYYLAKISKGLRGLILAIVLLLFINVQSFAFALYPPYSIIQGQTDEKNDITIDSLGVGKFSMLPAVKYINNNIDYSKYPLIFAGRYAEFILLLNLPMDPNRSLKSDDCSVCSPKYNYDIARDVFVESFYWNLHELALATSIYSKGFLITEDYCITDNKQSYLIENDENSMGCIQTLKNSDFQFDNINFHFIIKINNYRFYQWNK